MPSVSPTLALVSAAVLVAIAAAAAQVGRPLDPQDFDPRSGDVERGRAIVVGAFAARPGPGLPKLEPPEGACFLCHGIDGRGDSAAAFPRLTGQVYKYLYDSLRDYASGVRENAIMSPIARALTQQQMRDVSAYYAAQTDAPYLPPPQADPQLLQLGGALAAIGSAERGVQACINCHGPDGVGLPPTYPFLAGQHADYLEAQLLAWKTGMRQPDGFGIMWHIARRLTEEQIRAVSLYYASIRPEVVTPERFEAAQPMVPGPGPTTRILGR